MQGNDTIKMATSVLDYIFRELAISYLGRTEFANIDQSDVRHDAIGRGVQEGDLGRDAVAQFASSGYVRGNLRLLAGGGTMTEVQPLWRGPSSAGTVQPVEAAVTPRAPTNSRAEQAQIARLKGYVGDACPSCGNFTLVRNGTCLKCDTCGSTTGCS